MTASIGLGLRKPRSFVPSLWQYILKKQNQTWDIRICLPGEVNTNISNTGAWVIRTLPPELANSHFLPRSMHSHYNLQHANCGSSSAGALPPYHIADHSAAEWRDSSSHPLNGVVDCAGRWGSASEATSMIAASQIMMAVCAAWQEVTVSARFL